MTYKQKKKIIMLWISNKCIKEIFSIEKYIEYTEDLILTNLEVLDMKTTEQDYTDLRILMLSYINSIDLCFLDLMKEKIQLVLYAEFLIKMHTMCITQNTRDINIIRQRHQNRFFATKFYFADLDQQSLRWFFTDLRYLDL